MKSQFISAHHLLGVMDLRLIQSCHEAVVINRVSSFGDTVICQVRACVLQLS